jgi:hypothetical protein
MRLTNRLLIRRKQIDWLDFSNQQRTLPDSILAMVLIFAFDRFFLRIGIFIIFSLAFLFSAVCYLGSQSFALELEFYGESFLPIPFHLRQFQTSLALVRFLEVFCLAV